jgi:hypothetical protein
MGRAVIAALWIAGCGSGTHDRPAVPVDTYKAKDAIVVSISASGDSAVLRTQDSTYGKPHDLSLVERASGKVLGKARGFLVGRPSDREAYALHDRQLTAMASGKSVELELPQLPSKLDWEMSWSTVDHAGNTALIVLAEKNSTFEWLSDADRDRATAGYLIVEIDLASMSQRGHTAISMLGSRMALADVAALIASVETRGGSQQRVYGNAPLSCAWANTLDVAQLYLTCRVPEDRGSKVEHWVTTRYDGRTVAWSSQLEAPQTPGVGHMAGALTGDGKTLVLAHGRMKSGLIDADTTILVDAATGAARTLTRASRDPAVALGRIADLVPVPATSTVAQVHRYEPGAHSGGSRSFHGLSVVDATKGAMKVVLDVSTQRRDLYESVPDVVTVLPNGTYLLGL